jgi:sulfopyruvate decarboxylase TPP-binding subunit
MHTCANLAKECILPPLLAVPCDILENILQVPLSDPSIKVLSMTKEEQHKRKVEQLMEFL